MTQIVKVRLPLKNLVKFKAEVNTDKLEESLVNMEVFKPVKLTTTRNNYAGKIEFGIAAEDEVFTKEDIKAINRWCEVKLGMHDPVQRASFTEHIVKKHLQAGGAPRPWFRPAIYSVWDNLDAEFDNGEHSFYELALEMKDRAKENLHTLGINYTGALSYSLDVKYLTEEEYNDIRRGHTVGLLTDDEWGDESHRKMETVIPDDGGENRKKTRRTSEH